MDAVLELLDEVLLVAAIVRLEDHIARRESPLVRDEEEVAHVVEELLLALLDRDVLAQDDHAIRSLAGRRPVAELGDVLGLEDEVLVLALLDDTRLDVLRALTPARLDAVLRPALERLPCRFLELQSPFLEALRRVVAEQEADALLVPAVQMRRLAEVRVASQRDLAETCAATKRDRSVESTGSSLG